MQVDWNEREDAEDSGGHWSGVDTRDLSYPGE